MVMPLTRGLFKVIRVKVFEQLVFKHKVFETDGIRKQMVFEQLKTCGIRNIQC